MRLVLQSMLYFDFDFMTSPLTHSFGGISICDVANESLKYCKKQPLLRTERTKSREGYSTYIPPPSSVAKLFRNSIVAPL